MAAEHLVLQPAEGVATGHLDVEIVERKGLGHPDTLCDQMMEALAVSLARAYVERTGAIRHFNCDKALLVAGQVEPRWRGGRVLEPMRLVIGDRATTEWAGQDLHVDELAVDTAQSWIRRHLRHVDPAKHLVYDVALRPGSPELGALYAGQALANDTSAAAGYAPMTETERLVLEAERYANSAEFKTSFPETGEDVKVMGVRSGRRLDLTVAMPLLDRYLVDERDYFERKQRVQADLLAHVQDRLATLDEVSVNLNAADGRGLGFSGIYASVLGISAESADSGQVGRGNRANGLISLCRPAGAEAVAGKNPIGHVGKIYSMFACTLADSLVARLDGVTEATVWMCSRIGQPVDRPHQVFIMPRLAPGAAWSDVERPARAIVDEELVRLPAFCEALALGQHPLP